MEQNDQYQHLSIYRDVNILLLDEHKPFANGFLLPRGHLREPVNRINRADIILLIRKSDKPKRNPELKKIKYPPSSVFVYEPLQLVDQDLEYKESSEFLRDKKIILFSGIGSPEYLRKTVENCGGNIVQTYVFGDHYWYNKTDIKLLTEAKQSLDADILLTTEKDMVKIAALNTDTEFYGVGMKMRPLDPDSDTDIYNHIKSMVMKDKL